MQQFEFHAVDDRVQLGEGHRALAQVRGGHALGVIREAERLHAVEHPVQCSLVGDLPVEHRLDRLHVCLQALERRCQLFTNPASDVDLVACRWLASL